MPKRCCQEGIVQWDFWGEVQQGEGEPCSRNGPYSARENHPCAFQCCGGANPEPQEPILAHGVFQRHFLSV